MGVFTYVQRYHCDVQKNETILILISSKLYILHHKNQYLTSIVLNFKEALIFWAQEHKEFLAIRRAISLNETFVLFC